MSLYTPGESLDVLTVAAVGVTGALPVTPTGCWLLGFAFAEASGTTAATVQVITGNDATGQLVATFALAAGQTLHANPGTPGRPAPGGLFLQVTSGTADLSVTVGVPK